MIKNFRGISKTWVYSAETSPAFPLGKVLDVVVDPNIGKCSALWVQTLDGQRLLDFRDIKQWRGKEIFVSGQTDMLKPEEFPRISAILEREVPLIGADVFIKELEKERKIGTVEDFLFQIEFPLVLTIVVNTGWWFFGKKIEIPRAKIIEINDKGVFILDNVLKVEKEEIDPSVLPSLD